MRLVSICPSNTELLHYLDLTDKLVGVDNYSDWPQVITSLPKLGPDLNINMDKLEALKPDLVLASLSVPGMERNVAELEKRGIPHITLNPQSLEDIMENLLDVGKLTGSSNRATEVTGIMTEIINTYKQLATSVAMKPKLYWEWWPKPIFTPGKINWLTELSLLAGANNIFGDKEVASYQTEWSEVVEKNPDVVCMIWVGVKESKMNPDHVKKREQAELLKAIQHNHIYVLEESLYCRPSPRLIMGLQKLGSILHPEQYPIYPGVDPLEKPK
ncbi:cobalamin-binding protein [Sutcliffiella rhizosphaerae]|uniref:Vitamin B12-binding protein n=1 Tax=Sutcliffiella rhizosphaerae TaxID=2880967 RepID=A0ABM8YMJ1_9BACI|nr:cobalamin-binding protein [Sutcliffiella rhizosphaerae]CAG9621034.1 Vitamin B12-binding protein [Sutcliffiella rhizosphaerae]